MNKRYQFGSIFDLDEKLYQGSLRDDRHLQVQVKL